MIVNCCLHKHKKEIATHYVGKTGNKYSKQEYLNHGKGGVYKGFKDLPENEYPYTIKYSTEYLFKCCKLCLCYCK